MLMDRRNLLRATALGALTAPFAAGGVLGSAARAQTAGGDARPGFFKAKDIAEAASLPIHIFQDRAERERKQIPHLMLVGNLRFSLQAILAWEIANSVPGNAAAAVVEEADAPEEPPVPAKRWYELVREQDRERVDSAP